MKLFIFLSAFSLAAMLAAPVATAQDTPTASPGPTEEQLQQTRERMESFLTARDSCMDYYNFGSVTVSIDPTTSNLDHTYTAGESLVVRGTLTNRNNYPLTGGRMYAHILREDDTVAGTQWHPYVFQGYVPGSYNLGGNETKPFQYAWNIPLGSPDGTYRVELYYLVGDRYVLSGVPYVPNFTAAAAPFEVKNAPAIAAFSEEAVSLHKVEALNFDRSAITINGEAIELRSPGTLVTPGEPVTINTTLSAIGTSTPATVTARLYRWSITDGTQPLEKETYEVTPSPNSSVPISFVHENPQPGTYELVFEATGLRSDVLPSILNVRFPVEGLSPRIIYSGIGEIEDETATVSTCVVNATFGTGTGSVESSLSVNGKTVETQQTDASSDLLSSTLITAPVDDLTYVPFSINVVAKDADGNVTDETTITYADTTFGAEGVDDGTLTTPLSKTERAETAYTALVAIIAVVVVAGTIVTMATKKQSTSKK